MQNLGAAKRMPTSQILSCKKCVGWSPQLGGINMRFPRAEDLDAWYTTTLNHRRKLTGMVPNEYAS